MDSRERNARRIGTAPQPVVRCIGPELTGLGTPAAGIEHRHRRLVGEQLWPLPELAEETVMRVEAALSGP